MIEKNNNFIISEEEDENIISDNTNLFQEKLNKSKKKYLDTNIKNNKNISFDVSKINITKGNNKENKEKEKEGYLRILNISKDINDYNIYNKDKINLNSMKKLKEKEYNQSVPSLKIKNKKEKEKTKLNEVKISIKENIGTQSNASQFSNINTKFFGNKTYTYFPHIKKETTKENEKETKHKKNSAFDKNNKDIKPKNDDISFLLCDENFENKCYKKKPKKVLLINPDVITNYEIRKNTKSANRHKSNNKINNGFRTQKNLDKLVDEMIKGFIDKKKNRLITNGSGNYQTYNSLYDIITTYEMSYAQNQNTKNKK